jgi:hypothetical protein
MSFDSLLSFDKLLHRACVVCGMKSTRQDWASQPHPACEWHTPETVKMVIAGLVPPTDSMSPASQLDLPQIVAPQQEVTQPQVQETPTTPPAPVESTTPTQPAVDTGAQSLGAAS